MSSRTLHALMTVGLILFSFEIEAQARLHVVTSQPFSVNPNTVVPGGEVQATAWTVRNIGNSVSGNFKIAYYLSTDPVITPQDLYLGGETRMGLEPGAKASFGSAKLTVPANTVSGTYYVGMLIVCRGAVVETDNGSNFVSVPITINLPRPDVHDVDRSFKSIPTGVLPITVVALRPDLIVTSVVLWVANDPNTSFAPNQPIYTHSEVRIMPTFKNVGSAPADLTHAYWSVTGGPKIRAGTLISSANNSFYGGSLAPGETIQGLLPYFGPGQVDAGSYSLTITADSTGQVPEISKDNNTMTIPMIVLPSNRYTGQPNLRFANVTATEDTSSQCGLQLKYNFDATVINSGAFPAYLHGNSVIGSQDASTDYNMGSNVVILPGGTKTIRFTGSVDFGASKQFVFKTDIWQMVAESNETDNSYVITINAPPRPSSGMGDLVVSDAHFEHTTANGLYWLFVTLKNNGPGTVTICNSVSWHTKDVNTDLTWNANPPDNPVTLSPGQSWTPSTWAKKSLPSGTFTLTVEANPHKDVFETNYSNNLYPINVNLPPDVLQR